MGDVRMTIEAACGHGCNRTAKEGEEFQGCGQEGCPDCNFARFVSQLKRAGINPDVAKIQHWPADMAAHVHAGEEGRCVRCGVTAREARATHRCLKCGAFWIKLPDGSWTLASARCGKCCDNVEMGEQIEALPSGGWPAVCRTYDAAREVVDDYTERGVKYPTGGFVRATGKRVKGRF